MAEEENPLYKGKPEDYKKAKDAFEEHHVGKVIKDGKVLTKEKARKQAIDNIVEEEWNATKDKLSSAELDEVKEIIKKVGKKAYLN